MRCSNSSRRRLPELAIPDAESLTERRQNHAIGWAPLDTLDLARSAQVVLIPGSLLTVCPSLISCIP
jgi:hypothetical protein